MKAVNIRWNVDVNDIYSTIFSVTSSEAGEYLGISGPEFYSLSKCFEIYDIIKESFTADPVSYYELLDLPTEVVLPARFNIRLNKVTGKIESEVGRYLRETYGRFCERYILEEDECECMLAA